MRQDRGVSYADLENIGWPLWLIEDYQGLKRELRREITPLSGTDTNPNGIYPANLSGLYVKTSAPTGLWFNPNTGDDTGWIQIV